MIREDNLATRFKEFSENYEELAGDILSPPAKTPHSIHVAYHRSKLGNISTDVNPLVSAAAALLALANALKNLTLPPANIMQLYQDLCHEIKAFENKAQTLQYSAHVTLAARYALCALLDETILATAWGSKSQWQKQNLRNTFQNENVGEDKFFIIAERGIAEPTLYIDLLELLYVCLSLGYGGKYLALENGRQQLTDIIDSLYELIQQQRGEVSTTTLTPLIPITTITAAPATTLSRSLHLIPGWLIGIITLLLLAGIYLGFDYAINKNSTTLQHTLDQLVTTVPATNIMGN